MPNTFHSGKGGTVTINGTELAVTDWSVEPSAEFATFKNSKTGNFPVRERTFFDGRVTFGLDFDFDNNPFATPTTITAGAKITLVKLYLNGTAGIFWSFPSLIVDGTPQQLAVAGGITTRVTCMVDGSFAYPGGGTPA